MALNLNTINLFDFVVKQGNGVKGLVDSGISKVPNEYIQPVDRRISKTNIEHVVPLPLIDLSGLDGPEHDQVEEALVKAAETYGFFHVVNHGLPIQFLEELKDASHKFFNQPAEKKSVYMREVSPSPFLHYGTSFLPDSKKSFEWRDYFFMLYNSDDDALKYWPDLCREVVLTYIKASTKIARRILEILMKNIGVEVDDSMAETYMGVRVVNMYYYPTCPDPDLAIGGSRHSDFCVLTVLLQDDIGGLSIKVQEDGKEEKWIEIRPPIPGALLINIGDTLQILSNGKYQSTEYRVRTSTQSRVSVPLYLFPGPKVKIGPLPQVVEKDGQAQYKECLFGDYKSQYFARGYSGKQALDFVKITPP